MRRAAIEEIDKPGFTKIDTGVGRRLGVHCTAVGKALIAQLKLEKLKGYVRLIKQAARYISQRLGYKGTSYHPAATQKDPD